MDIEFCEMAASSRQKGQNKRMHGHPWSCTYRVVFSGDGCRHWSEEIERESEFYEIRISK